MGEAVVDVLPAGPGLWRPVAGGSSFNVAMALGRLGAPAGFAGTLSADAQGAAMRAQLAEAGVSVALTATSPLPSPLSLVAPGSETTSAQYSIYLAETAHVPPGLPANWTAGIAHLHVSSFSAVTGAWGEAVLAALTESRGKIGASLDINIRPGLLPSRAKTLEAIERRLELVDMVKASDEDLAWLFPDESPAGHAAEWSRRFSCLVLLTQGADGATAFCGGEAIYRPGLKVAVADTVGAGDIFVAAILARARENGLLARLRSPGAEPLAGLLDFANAAAALTCARKGADAPTRQEIDAFVRSF